MDAWYPVCYMKEVGQLTENQKRPYVSVRDMARWYPYKGKKIRTQRPGEKAWIKAADQINVEMERGEILGVIGESGCGKSTLGKILTGLEQPTSGDCYIDGVSTREMIKKNQKEFYRQVQIVFQNPFDTFTPRDRIEKILMRPLKNYKIGDNDKERYEMCIRALESGGFYPASDIMKRYPHELSGGQLQRISIIRSMFLEPGFIIADEPVSMLDVSVRAEIINMLMELARRKDAAVMFISHDIALTRYISDYIAVMYLGRIVEYGTADQVVKSPAHPYTKALISNCASIDPEEKSASIPIEGEPPTPLNPGPGCYFAPRCHMALKECFERYPKKEVTDKGHWAACARLT